MYEYDKMIWEHFCTFVCVCIYYMQRIVCTAWSVHVCVCLECLGCYVCVCVPIYVMLVCVCAHLCYACMCVPIYLQYVCLCVCVWVCM